MKSYGPLVVVGATALGLYWLLSRKKSKNFEEENTICVAGVGWNGFGQLGTGDVNFCESVTLLKQYFPDVKSVVSGGLHYGGFSVLLTEHGEAYACGDNSKRCLPFEESHLLRFTKCSFKPNVATVSCGSMHSVFVFEDGTVVSFGDNTFGQLGRSNGEEIEFPKDTFISGVSCGDAHTLFLDSEGRLYGCGNNRFGQIGEQRVGENIAHPLLIAFEFRVRQASAGQCHSIVLAEDGSVWTFGGNSHGQIGVTGEYFVVKAFQIRLEEKIKSISAGNFHNVCLSENGKCYVFGSNEYGQLGLSNKEFGTVVSPQLLSKDESYEFATAGSFNTFVLSKEGKCYACGWNSESQCGMLQKDSPNGNLVQIPVSNKVIHVSASDCHTMFLVED